MNCPIPEQVESIYFVNSAKGWAGGVSGSIIATNDGGLTWSSQASGSIQTITGIAFADDQRGWAVDIGGLVWTTSNGGQKWQQSYSPPLAVPPLDAVDCVGPHGCCGVGVGIVLTDNDGATWTADSTGMTLKLYDVDFVDAAHGWAVGMGGTNPFF